MGEEVDAVLIKKVKLTQDVLGSFIRRPPLTEKHLVKPPFRFLHDIVMSVIENTGFLYGLYEGPELDATTITSRETKTAFMQKLVDCLRLATGEEVDVKISKILAGQEPGKTNDLLISLGNALARNISSDKAVQQITGKDLNNAANSVKSKGSVSDVPREKKKAPPVAKNKEASSPYSTSVQQKKPAKGPTKGDVKKALPEKSKNIAPTKSQVQGKQSKTGVSNSPPKATPKTPQRQGSSDRLAKGKQAVSEKSPPKQSASQKDQGIKDGRRTSVRGSIDDGPASFGEGDGSIQDETRASAGSRRESLTSMTTATVTAASAASRERESRSMSKYGRAGPSQRGSISGSSGGNGEDIAGPGLGSGPGPAFISPEAHADDVEQAEFMGELEFLLKKHGYEGEGDSGRHESDNDDNDEGIEGAKTETLNNNIPGSNQKESLTRKGSFDNSNTSQGPVSQSNDSAGMSSIDNELNSNNVHDNDNHDESDDNQNETMILSPPLPKSRQSATPKRIKTATPSSANITPRTPSASTSALSLSNSALGRPLSPSHSPAAKLSPSLLLPDINEKPLLRPPSARPHTSQMRPGGPATTMSIPRPPSARPAPPRPKTALFQDKDESTFRPTTAKVANVLLDAEDADDDNNYIVHEVVAPEKNPGELHLDETADLGISGNLMEENIDMILDPGQRGLLVTQMLDAQNKLEDGSRLAPTNAKKTDIERDPAMGDKDRMRWREMTVTEVEKLKNLMQLMARNANPLGKLMDFVQEDVDAMQRDLNKWREESRKLDNALEAAQEETERSLEPLRRKMAELDEAIQDRQDSIAATKMTIYRQEERIRKVLTGLDRVKPRSGNEPKITSADLHNLIDLDDNYEYGDNKNKVYFKKATTPLSSMNPSSPSPV